MWLFIIFACLNACVDPSFNSGASNRQYKCEQIAVLFIQNVSAEPTLGEFMIMKAYCDFFRDCTGRQRLYTTWEILNLRWCFTREDKSCVLKARNSDWVSRKHRRP